MNEEQSIEASNIIYSAMKRLDVDQKEIYLSLGFTKSSMSNYIHGRHLTTNVVIKIANYLDDYQTTVEIERVLFNSEPYPAGSDTGATPLEISIFYRSEDHELANKLQELQQVMAGNRLNPIEARQVAFEAIDVVSLCEKLVGTLQQQSGLTSSQLMDRYLSRAEQEVG